MTPRRALTIACLFLCVWHGTPNPAGAYTLSNGRRILLDRGLQIQSNVYEWGMSNVPLWCSANFTAMNFYAPPNAPWEQAMLSQLPAGRHFGKKYDISYSPSKYLTSTELPYADRFVSMQYGDELQDIAEQARLDDMKATYEDWHSRYPNALAYTSSYGWGPHSDPSLLRGYMQYTRPDMLMFDFYPEYPDMTYHVDRRTAWYGIMQNYRSVALEGYDGSRTQPIAYGQYLHLWRTDADSPYQCESYVRLQQSASWAFGYTFTQAYVYNDTGSTSGGVAAMFSSRGDSSPTDVFRYAAESNRQGRNLGPALVRLVSTDIRMIPATYGTHQGWFWDHGPQYGTVDDDLPLPDDIQLWTQGDQDTGGYVDYITGITPLGKDNGVSHIHNDVLIGYFAPLLANNSGCTFADGLHFMIVNGAWEGTSADSAEWYHLTFDFTGSDFDSLTRLNRETGRVQLVALTPTGGATYALDMNVPGGAGDLFGFWSSGDPLPTVPEPGSFILLVVGLIVATLCYRTERNWCKVFRCS